MLCVLMHRYQREFGFTIPSRDIRVDDIRVRAMGRACSHNPTPMITPTTDPPVSTKVSHRINVHCIKVLSLLCMFSYVYMLYCAYRVLTPVVKY